MDQDVELMCMIEPLGVDVTLFFVPDGGFDWVLGITVTEPCRRMPPDMSDGGHLT